MGYVWVRLGTSGYGRGRKRTEEDVYFFLSREKVAKRMVLLRGIEVALDRELFIVFAAPRCFAVS
jgi:hypothetical protein